ncbi:hypothetical protein Q1695_007772 [Nippostrongylus brasiliensis]|nr:hypothetical protein Q1695_007772 [Nippostrongylus brasiliensis]
MPHIQLRATTFARDEHNWTKQPNMTTREPQFDVGEAAPDVRIARFLRLVEPAHPLSFDDSRGRIFAISSVAALLYGTTGWILASTGIDWTIWTGISEVDEFQRQYIDTIVSAAFLNHVINPRERWWTWTEWEEVFSQWIRTDRERPVVYSAVPWWMILYVVEKFHGLIEGQLTYQYRPTSIDGAVANTMTWGWLASRTTEWQALMRITSILGPVLKEDTSI